VNRAVYALACSTDALEQRLEEVDERTTALAIGQGAIAAALDRTEALAGTLERLEARAVVLELATAKLARVTVSDAMGLAGPALAWVKGEISTGRWAEVLTEWQNGKRSWTADDCGLPSWPEPPPWMGEEDIVW